jgi:hypothetical protein
MEIETFENVQFTLGNHNGWDQKSVVGSGKLEANFPDSGNVFSEHSIDKISDLKHGKSHI